LAVPAVAATKPDEIYTAIEAHRRAYEVYIETMNAADVPGTLATLMDVEYIEELLLSVEYAICAHAGLPEPQVPEQPGPDVGSQDDDA
jgi:hypothetical protein